jgi:hypothetical protein
MPRSAWRVALADERFASIERCASGGVRSVCDVRAAFGADPRSLALRSDGAGSMTATLYREGQTRSLVCNAP